MDYTSLRFDRPDERHFLYERMIPMLHRNDAVELEDGVTYYVRSCALGIAHGGTFTMHVRLAPHPVEPLIK